MRISGSTPLPINPRQSSYEVNDAATQERERAKQVTQLQQGRPDSSESAAQKLQTPSAEPSIIVNRQSVERPFSVDETRYKTVRNEDKFSQTAKNALNSYSNVSNYGAIGRSSGDSSLVGVDLFV